MDAFGYRLARYEIRQCDASGQLDAEATACIRRANWIRGFAKISSRSGVNQARGEIACRVERVDCTDNREAGNLVL